MKYCSSITVYSIDEVISEYLQLYIDWPVVSSTASETVGETMTMRLVQAHAHVTVHTRYSSYHTVYCALLVPLYGNA